MWHRIPGENLHLSSSGVTIQENNSSGYCKYSDAENKGTITYTYTAHRSGFLCIHLNLPKRNDYYVSVNGVELFKEAISLPQMMAVGDVEAGDTIDIRMVCDADESSTMTLNAAVLDMQRFRRGYDILNASTLELTEFESTHLEGRIHCDREGLLYTSIPQNGNWVVRVDGEEADTRLVGDCMLAVPLTAGDHRLEFTYENRAFSLGWKVSLACAGIFGLLWWAGYQPRIPALEKTQKRGKFQK